MLVHLVHCWRRSCLHSHCMLTRYNLADLCGPCVRLESIAIGVNMAERVGRIQVSQKNLLDHEANTV
jgi:hypothetical protein